MMKFYQNLYFIILVLILLIILTFFLIKININKKFDKIYII